MEWHLKFITAIIINFVIFSVEAQTTIQTSPIFKKQKIEIVYKQIKKTVELELAESITQHAYGLMNRTRLSSNSGMIFVFENEEPRQFWMKNTLIDLDIAYIDKEKTIIDIQTMKSPKTIMQNELPTYPSKKPAQYAIEMNAGWFKKHKIKLGGKIKFISGPTSKKSN